MSYWCFFNYTFMAWGLRFINDFNFFQLFFYIKVKLKLSKLFTIPSSIIFKLVFQLPLIK